MNPRLDVFIEALLREACMNPDRALADIILYAKHVLEQEDEKALAAEKTAEECLYDNYGSDS